MILKNGKFSSIMKNGKFSLDDNECVDGNNYCVDAEKGGICVNIDGSFICSCQTGYTGDGNDYQKWTKLAQSGPVIKISGVTFQLRLI